MISKLFRLGGVKGHQADSSPAKIEAREEFEILDIKPPPQESSTSVAPPVNDDFKILASPSNFRPSSMHEEISAFSITSEGSRTSEGGSALGNEQSIVDSARSADPFEIEVKTSLSESELIYARDKISKLTELPAWSQEAVPEELANLDSDFPALSSAPPKWNAPFAKRSNALLEGSRSKDKVHFVPSSNGHPDIFVVDDKLFNDIYWANRTPATSSASIKKVRGVYLDGPNAIVVRFPAVHETRTEWHRMIVHENAHAQGGGEYEAFIAQDEYESSVTGQAPRFKTPGDILMYLSILGYDRENTIFRETLSVVGKHRASLRDSEKAGPIAKDLFEAIARIQPADSYQFEQSILWLKNNSAPGVTDEVIDSIGPDFLDFLEEQKDALRDLILK